MSQRRLYHGALFVDPADSSSQDLQEAALLVEEGKIIGKEARKEDFQGLETQGLEEIDVQGCVLLPGLFDINVHLREPGREDTETIATGSKAALHGGVTGMLMMPNTEPAIDSAGLVRSVYQTAIEEAKVELHVAGCLTRSRLGKELAELGSMAQKNALLVTDDHAAVADARLMRRAMEYAGNFNLIVGTHPDTPELSNLGVINEGEVSYRLGLRGMPACAEELGIMRDLHLAELTGCHLHIQHVSTAVGVEIIRRYKEKGVRVSAEVTPHHLLLDEEDVEQNPYDSNFKMTPPLRTKKDRKALLDGLKEGVLDVIATDHAPHSKGEKQVAFESAPFGVVGLETALPSLYDRLISLEQLSWQLLVQRFSTSPRQILGLDAVSFQAGAEANFTIFDPNSHSIIDEQFFLGKSSNTPFLGQRLLGRVRETVYKQVLQQYAE